HLRLGSAAGGRERSAGALPQGGRPPLRRQADRAQPPCRAAGCSLARLTYRTSGEAAVLRQLFRGRVWNAAPTIVVEDGPHRTVLWLPSGGTYAIGDDLFGDWSYELRVARRDQLRIKRRGDPYSVFLFMNEDRSFRGWYVNLERPHERTDLGFDYEDDLLDVWVALGAEPELLD